MALHGRTSERTIGNIPKRTQLSSDVDTVLSNNTATLILEGGGSVLKTKLRVVAGSGALGGWDESRTPRQMWLDL